MSKDPVYPVDLVRKKITESGVFGYSRNVGEPGPLEIPVMFFFSSGEYRMIHS